MVFCTRRRVLRPLSATMQSMNEAKTGRSWLTEAKQDISQWSGIDAEKTPTMSASTGIGSCLSTWNTASEPPKAKAST